MAVGVVGVAASCAVGFTIGTLLPGRFTAPVVAIAVFVAWFIGVAAANSVNNFVDVGSAKGTAALFVSTDGGRLARADVGVYYHASPDVSIAQVMFMGGVLLVMASLLALLPAARVPGVRDLPFAGRRWLTVVAAVGTGHARLDPGAGGGAAQVTAAARGFESLPPAARRAWLAANVTAPRSGAITLAQLPWRPPE